jgi:4-hydroxybenzoate polyprenyltransferase
MTDVSLHGETPDHSLAADLLASLRPEQWTKNLVVFAGLVFGGQLLEPGAVARAGGTYIIFCALSSAMYLVNDVGDRARDLRHPVKSTRPIAAGRVSSATALGVAGLLIACGAASALLLDSGLALLALAFVGLLTLYSTVLKQVVILDVLVIAIGFVLRAAAGAVVIDVPISQWLLVCTLLLALFLALTKRRQEIVALGTEAMEHRPTLGHYSPQLLDQLVTVVAAGTLVSYAVYTTGAETVEKFGTDLLTLTIPFPIYGVLRYLMLVRDQARSTGPSDILLRDRPLAVCVAGWALSVAVIIYRGSAF